MSILLLSSLLAACSAPSAVANPIPVTGTSAVASPSATTETPAQQNQAPESTPPVTTSTAQLSPTLAVSCKSPAALTPAQTEGPYFKVGSPERASLLDAGITGIKLVLSGYVFTSDCQLVTHALLDFWQANAQGQYDNSGYTLRGYQYTDADGFYQLETIIPGLYPGRTEHIHVKVQAPGGPILTTQLYFPGVQQNESDSIYDSHLLVTLQDASDGKIASFNFVINPQ